MSDTPALRLSPPAPAGATYVVQIRSDAPIEQKYTRGCLEMDSIKRALKTLFKKKSKRQEQEKSPEPRKPETAQKPATTQKPAQTDSLQQVLASEDTGKPGPTYPETTIKVPSTQPLSTGTHARPQEALPQDDAAQPGLAPDSSVADGPEGAETAMEQRHEQEMSQTAPTAGIQSRSKPLPEVGREAQSASEPQMDGAADAVLAAPPEAAAAAPAVTESQPAHITSTGEPDPAPAEITNRTLPDTISHATDASKLTAEPASLVDSAHQVNARYDDDKIPVMSEPPTIKAVRAAPGMSATSGPLEDFPEGDFR